MEQESVMNGTTYEAATWYDIERNKMHLKKDGESYVADAMLLRESISLRQENDRLKKENDKLRELCIDMASHLREAERIYGDELLPEGYITRMRELGIEVDQ